jgi:hypothetical protein
MGIGIDIMMVRLVNIETQYLRDAGCSSTATCGLRLAIFGWRRGHARQMIRGVRGAVHGPTYGVQDSAS